MASSWPRTGGASFGHHFTASAEGSLQCRPWWWDLITVAQPIAATGAKASRSLALKIQLSSRIALATDVSANIRFFPWRCVPLCDGIVEVYQRLCCCRRIIIDDLLDRIPRHPDPDPDPLAAGSGPGSLWPGTRPLEFRGPILRQGDPTSLGCQGHGRRHRPGFRPHRPASGTAVRSLSRFAPLLPRPEAERYVLDRPWLFPLLCTCTTRKVLELTMPPIGEFDFCYRRYLPPFPCYYSYAYRVRQFINGAWVSVTDGIAANAWFSDGEQGDVRVTHPKALPCGDPDADPPPNDGTAFVMLEYVTGPDTHHHNFPGQTGVSQVGHVS